MKFFNLTLLFFLFSVTSFSQKTDYLYLNIPDSLKQNANTVVRLHQVDIVILSQRNMKIKTKRVVTVLNEKGLSDIDAVEGYDKKTSVNDIQATVYNSFGTEIKKIKRKDFIDQARIDGVTVFSDSRFLYLKYVPTDYPFTVVYESEIETSNTAFIPTWMPITNYNSSVEKSVLNVVFPEKLGFKYKEFNFSGFKIKKNIDSPTQLSFVTENIIAQKQEEKSPKFTELYPKVMFGLENFNLEGVDGNAKTWSEFGKWYYDNLLQDTFELSEETKIKIKNLVGNETDLIKKAQIIYKFVQEKSRYVSIQVGIGGFKPMLAKDVDRLGYGDCKALSNYTKALLESVNVTSYNTLLYGDRIKNSIKSDFVSVQGNHMILCIPNQDKNIFLECTSQDDPFGYQGIFTDDRDVLIIKPEGGEIVHTTIYEDEKNTQKTKGKFEILENGDFLGAISMVSSGAQYALKSRIEKEVPTEKEKHYKEYWDYISNLKISNLNFVNDKEKITFTENATLSAENFGKISGTNLIFNVNAFNQHSNNLKRIRNRKTPFEIQRGFVDTDEIEIKIPIGFAIESVPENVDLNSKFGNYKTVITKKDAQNSIYNRTFFVKKALYKNSEYEEYRNFMEQVSKNDNAKIVLIKTL
jgi:hypothetical protein